MRKNYYIAVLAGFMTMAMSMTAFAAGWEKNETGWKYINDAGTYPSNTWQWIDGNGDKTAECYYFDENGYCLMDTTTPDGYRVNGSGAWVKDGVVQTKVTGTTSNNITSNATQALIGSWAIEDIMVGDEGYPSTIMHYDKFTNIHEHWYKDLEFALNYGSAARNIYIAQKEDGTYSLKYFTDGLEWTLQEYSDGILYSKNGEDASYFFMEDGKLMTTSTNQYVIVNANSMKGSYHISVYTRMN